LNTVTSRGRAVAALHFGAFLWAFASTLLGPALPLINRDLHLGYAAGGSVFTLSSAGFLTGSLVVAAASTRFGVRTLMLASTGMLLPCLYAISQVSSYPLLLTAVGLTGIAGGALTSLVNAGVSDLSANHRAAALSLLNVSFGSGALLAPLFAGAVISRTSRWTPMYQLTSVLVLALLLLAVWCLPRAAGGKAAAGPGPGSMRSLLFHRRGMLTFATVFLAAAVEWGFAYWSATYFRDVVGAGTVLAVNMVSLFWAGMLVGRLAFGGLLRRVDPHRTVTVCAATAVAASALLAANAGIGLSVAGALLLGCSLAAVIPSLLALAIDAQPHASGAISGLLMFASGGGSLAAPAIVGIIADRSSLAAAIWLFPVLALVLLVVHGTTKPAPIVRTISPPAMRPVPAESAHRE
jgi:MFS transporter, FHS family, glucose/mannose:H+ symporter